MKLQLKYSLDKVIENNQNQSIEFILEELNKILRSKKISRSSIEGHLLKFDNRFKFNAKNQFFRSNISLMTKIDYGSFNVSTLDSGILVKTKVYSSIVAPIILSIVGIICGIFFSLFCLIWTFLMLFVIYTTYWDINDGIVGILKELTVSINKEKASL